MASRVLRCRNVTDIFQKDPTVEFDIGLCMKEKFKRIESTFE